MPSLFTLRMQFGPHEDPGEITAQLLELVRSAPVDEIMFFYFAEEQNQGHEPVERIRLWIERSRPYRDALRKEGVAVSLNPWHTILHADRDRKLNPRQQWQTLVDPNGRAATAQVCPLDRNWRAYFEETLRLYAGEDFRVIWIDDDIRFHNHPPLEWGGCFCPLHVAEFNRRAGVRATREEIVANCTAPGKPHPWRSLWMDMWDETQCELVSRWRDIVEERGSHLGLMSSYPEPHGAEGRRWARWWQAFGGGKPPIHRLAFWYYTDVRGSDIPDSIALLDQMRTVQPREVESGPEVDNGPYGRWNRPFAELGAQVSLAHIMGSTNLNISLYDFMGNRPDDEPERAEFLREWRPACDRLADEFPMTLRSVGVGIPWSEDMGRKVRTDGSGEWKSLEVPTRGWAHWLGAAGIAFSMRPKPRVNAIAGRMAWVFDDEEVLDFLSAGLLLDGGAAAILVERGFGEKIGLASARMITQADVLYSIEECADAAFALREGARMSANAYPHCRSLLQGELLDGARAASQLLSPRWEVVGHGLVAFENDLGGRVAIVPWSANAPVMMNIQRVLQLQKTLLWLDPENHFGWVDGGAWLFPQFLTDGKLWRGVVWNGGGDEVEAITVHTPATMPAPQEIVQVDAHGRRHDCRFENGVVGLNRPLYTWEYVLLL
ncbi:MAG: hypothetical protein ACYTAN_08175 [Planctomycetota bacterium]